MTDLAVFADAEFDAKAWVNAAAAAKPQDEQLERYLAELEMRLHLAAEDVEAALEDASLRALQRIPAAVLEVGHVKGEVVALRGDVARSLGQVDGAAAEAGASVAQLLAADRVKSRMEAACSTLTEATELSELFARMDGLFAAGDLPAVGAALATMRRSLALVGDVPEFRGGVERLAGLEDRLQLLAEGPLATALAERDGERAQMLCGLLAGIGRTGAIDKLYLAARITPLQIYWESYERGGGGPMPLSFPDWLPGFYDEVLAAAESELRWVSALLPEHHPRLLLHLLAGLFARIDKAFRVRLAAVASRRGDGGAQVLGSLQQLQDAAADFVAGLQRLLAGVPREELLPLVSAVYAPFEAQVSRYGELEGKQLAADVGALPQPGLADADDVEAVVAGMAGSVAGAVVAVQAAAERCIQFSGGTELPALLKAADDSLVQYISNLQGMLFKLRKQCLPQSPQPEEGNLADGTGGRADTPLPPPATAGGLDGEPAAGSSTEEGSAVLLLLNVAGSLISRIGVLDASLRSAISDLGGLLAASPGPDSIPTPMTQQALRLWVGAGGGGAAAHLGSFVAAAEDARFAALPGAIARAEAFQAAVHALVYDVLMVKVRAAMSGVAGLRVWGASRPDNEFGLPAFSAYPLPYVTVVGEHLMMLPQILEGALTAGGPGDEEEEGHIDAEWLDKVAAGAAELYARQLSQLIVLGSAGAGQLAADLEYFLNVLSALSVAIPPSLATWQVAAGWSESEFATQAASSEERGFDPASVRAVARARNIALKSA